ncbi:MAG: DUF5107 domain-containing protein [Ginsengibacter sp.]
MPKSFSLLCLMLFLTAGCLAQKLSCREYEDYMLTCQLTPAGPIPTAFDPDGVYPYVSYVETSNRPVLKKYKFIVLENDQLKITICPDLGGKVTSIFYKPSAKEILYKPDVVRYTRILPRFYFVAGGIEVSFPISHSPTQNETLLYKIDSTKERIYVSCGERELRFGMQWTVEYSLGRNDHFLTERVVYHNPGTEAYPWMSWSNAALPSAPDTRFYFPRGRVLSHSSKVDTIEWVKEGPKTEADIKEMTGYFWETKDVNAFGAYTPSFGTGLYHIADEKIASGIKLWSYGNGDDSAWSVLSTAKHQTYLEIQGGPIGDQSIKLELQPGETRWHSAYWFPTDKPLDIYSLKVPEIKLRPLKNIPLFQWARAREVKDWLNLSKAYQQKKGLKSPPEINQRLWAPSGMEKLDAAFKWAIKQTSGHAVDLWKFYYGTWLAGRNEKQQSIQILSQCNIGVGKALLARQLNFMGNIPAAVNAINSIHEPWLQLHPQLVVERDQILRRSGIKSSLTEREKWLSKVDALKDEWVIERRVQLLIDEDKAEQAKDLLLSVPFQKVHQTYTRTDLWEQITKKLNIPFLPIPEQLGEDRLAHFGAYREYEEK